MQDPFISIDYSSPAAFSSIMGPTKNRSSLSISHLLGQRHRLSSHRYKPLPWELHFASHTSSSRQRPYGNHQYLGHTGTLSPTVGTSPESHYLDHIDFASMLSVPRSCGTSTYVQCCRIQEQQCPATFPESSVEATHRGSDVPNAQSCSPASEYFTAQQMGELTPSTLSAFCLLHTRCTTISLLATVIPTVSITIGILSTNLIPLRARGGVSQVWSIRDSIYYSL